MDQYTQMMKNLFERTYLAKQRFYSTKTMKLSEREGNYIEYHTLYMLIILNNLEFEFAEFEKFKKKKMTA